MVMTKNDHKKEKINRYTLNQHSNSDTIEVKRCAERQECCSVKRHFLVEVDSIVRGEDHHHVEIGSDCCDWHVASHLARGSVARLAHENCDLHHASLRIKCLKIQKLKIKVIDKTFQISRLDAQTTDYNPHNNEFKKFQFRSMVH